MLLRVGRALGLAGVAGLVAAASAGGCGAKSGLREPSDAGRPDGATDAGVDATVACRFDADCALPDRCLVSLCEDRVCTVPVPISCDDGDECTEDSCDSDTGECQSRELTSDQDGDGFKGPRPGFAPGAPGACGDDCDDTSPLAFPGAEEVCDGVDNDCDGIVDNDARYEPVGPESVRVSALDLLQAGAGGLAFSGSLYAAAYAGQKGAWRSYVKGLDSSGATAFGDEPITNIPSDTFTGPIVWTGSMFATVWEDRRDNDYEIYFNRLAGDGKKLGPDLRISNAPGFSLHPVVIWNGAEFLVVWDDRRNGPQNNRLYGRRVSIDGQFIGDELELSPSNLNAELPTMAQGEKTVGVAFNSAALGGAGFEREVYLRLFNPDLGGAKPVVLITKDLGINPSVVFSKDRYVVAYGKRDTAPKDAIWGAVVDENGTVLVPEKRITFGASFARTQALLPLGDRLLLVWADDFHGNYELYTKMLSLTLDDLTPRQRITVDAAESVGPNIAFGPDGDVGVLFDDRRTGSWQSYFTRLVCKAGD